MNGTAFMHSFTIRVRHLLTVRASGLSGWGAKVIMFLQTCTLFWHTQWCPRVFQSGWTKMCPYTTLHNWHRWIRT